MKVFVAGASGTIGIPLVRALVAAGHQVTAMTRTPDKQDGLRSLGATPVVADALDAGALTRAVVAAAPTHVIHELTALPKGGVRSAKDLEPTNQLRTVGTRNLLAAAIAAKAERIIVGSFALFGAAPPDAGGRDDEGAAAVRSMESQVLEASRKGQIEGVVLRYGLFYGPDNPAIKQMIAMARRRMLPVVRGDRSLLPIIHIDDAVAATVAALDHPPSPEPGARLADAVYNIVDDRAVSMTDFVRGLAESVGAPRPFAVPAWLPRLLAPYMSRITSLRLPLSNAKARADLGWRPIYPTMGDGLSRTMRSAA